VGSFQVISCWARFFPLLSVIVSVVDIVENFKSPLAAAVRLAL
jgi:hypothetical protein